MRNIRFDPTARPGLAYCQAFDWLAMQLQATDGPVAALAPRTFHGAELLRRLPHLPFLAPLPRGLRRAAASLGLAPPTEIRRLPGSLLAIAWTEPASDDVGHLDKLKVVLHSGGHLYLVAPGPLGRFLAEHREDDWGRLLSGRQVLGQLRSRGWHVVQRRGLHSPRAVAHHYAGQLAARFGRDDWQDRLHFAMRRDFVERGTIGHQLSALVLIVAEKLG